MSFGCNVGEDRLSFTAAAKPSICRKLKVTFNNLAVSVTFVICGSKDQRDETALIGEYKLGE